MSLYYSYIGVSKDNGWNFNDYIMIYGYLNEIELNHFKKLSFKFIVFHIF